MLVLLFLLMINCDLCVIFWFGLCVLVVFVCIMVSLFIVFIVIFLIYCYWLCGDDWYLLVVLFGSWVGGIVNMIGVK